MHFKLMRSKRIWEKVLFLFEYMTDSMNEYIKRIRLHKITTPRLD